MDDDEKKTPLFFNDNDISDDNEENNAGIETLKLTLEQKYEKIILKNRCRGCGFYQGLVATSVMCGMIGQAFLDVNMGYMTVQPEYLCNDGTEVCYADTICGDSNQPQEPYTINYNNPESIHNWVQQLNLICASPLAFSLFGQMSFLAAAISNLPVTILADRFGRRLIYRTGVIIQFCVFVTLIFSKSRYISYTAMFIEGFVSPMVNMVGYVYMCEFMTTQWQDNLASIYSFIYAFVTIVITFYFQVVSKDWRWIVVVGLIQLGIAGVLSFFITESPLWLLNMDRIEEGQNAVRNFCRVNGNLDSCDDLIDHLAVDPFTALQNHVVEDDGSPVQDKIKPTKVNLSSQGSEDGQRIRQSTMRPKTTIDFLKEKRVIINLIAMCSLWAMSSMLYYFMSYYVVYLPGNTFENNYASGGAEMAACLLGGVLLKVFGAKYSFLIGTSISLIGGMLILFIGEDNKEYLPAFVVLAKFGISAVYMLVYAVTIDLFPTLFSAQAFGMCNLVANLTTIGTPYLAQMDPPIPMICFNVLCIVGFVMSFVVQVDKEKQKEALIAQCCNKNKSE